jgi:hypothetical protein
VTVRGLGVARRTAVLRLREGAEKRGAELVRRGRQRGDQLFFARDQYAEPLVARAAGIALHAQQVSRANTHFDCVGGSRRRATKLRARILNRIPHQRRGAHQAVMQPRNMDTRGIVQGPA